MDFYQLNLAVFVATNGYLLYRQYNSNSNKKTKEDIDLSLAGSADLETAEKRPDGGAARRFQFNFFLPYALAVAADWLQVCTAPGVDEMGAKMEVFPLGGIMGRLLISVSTGTSYLRYLQIREELAREDGCSAICCWLRIGGDQRLLCWWTG